MIIQDSIIREIIISDIIESHKLDPVTVYLKDLAPGQGKITIECYGKSWSAYWGGMGKDNTIADFFCSCDEHYIAGKLSSIESQIFDIDKIRADAEEKGIECWRDDPWNDHEFMAEMYGSQMEEWHYLLPKCANPDYEYLCRIIKVVQDAIREHQQDKAA